MAVMWSPRSGRPAHTSSQFYYVSNFKDYRFLQVFYPTRGILAWYDRRRRSCGRCRVPTIRTIIQSNAVWSPDGKYLVFRARRREGSLPRRRQDGRLRQRPAGSADSIRSLSNSLQRRQRGHARAHRRRFAERHEQQLSQDLPRRQVDRLRARRTTASSCVPTASSISFRCDRWHAAADELQHIADEFLAQLLAQWPLAGVFVQEPLALHADVPHAHRCGWHTTRPPF